MENFPEDLKKMVAEISILKRIGTVEEVANIVSFVASPEASWLTGELIVWELQCRLLTKGDREPDSGEWWSPFCVTELRWVKGRYVWRDPQGSEWNTVDALLQMHFYTQ